jgi:primosomal protein N' (replication factor Y)
LLETFAGHGADILVGTQMIAKGLDIPSVDLVGVMLADLGIHAPDFQAAERTFQVLMQVAGRAGRGPHEGHVVIQTYAPEHYAIEAAAAQDYEGFYAKEIAYRQAQGNPPLSLLVRLTYSNSNQRIGLRETQRFGGLLRRVAADWDMKDVDIIGPAPAYPPRSRNAWRWHVLVRAPQPRRLLDKVGIPPAWHVDVDPLSVS